MSTNLNDAVTPWYRERWPWILMAGPAVVVVAGFITAWLAIRSNDGLVEDDYYKRGLAVNESIHRDQRAGGLGLHAELMLGGDGREVRMFLAGHEGVTLPAKVVVKFVHPTRAGADQNLSLEAAGGGFYGARLAEPLKGRWHVTVEDGAKEWRLSGDWVIEKQDRLQLSAADGVTDSIRSNSGR